MSELYLGRPFDVHGGGVDLIFPHHENEKAQADAAYDDGLPFARFWMHNGFVNLNGEKMAKSTGNYVTISQLLDEQGPAAVRLLNLQAHYRTDIDFSPPLVEEMVTAVRRLAGARRRLADAAGAVEAKPTEPVVMEAFVGAMDDDMNTAAAVASLFELVKAANVALERGAEADEAAALLAEFDELTGILGLDLATPSHVPEGLVGDLVGLLLEVRAEARTRKDWAQADAIRDRLRSAGIVVEDGEEGPVWHLAD